MSDEQVLETVGKTMIAPDAVTRQFVRESILRISLRGEDARAISSRGGYLKWMIDLRPAFLQRDLVTAIAIMFWRHYRDFGPLQLGAVETAGIPLLTALLLCAPPERGNVSGFIVRKQRKTTGMGNLIEGPVTDDPIIFVDDVINSGSSIEKARTAIELSGQSIEEIFTVIDYRSKVGLAWRQRHDLAVRSLFTLNDFGLGLTPNPPPLPQPYRELWRAAVPGGFAFHVVPKSSPVLVGDMIFRGCDAGRMHAFDARTGAIVWEHEATGAAPRKGIWSSPAVHDGRLYYGAYNGVLYALDALTGQEFWSQSCCEWIGASPLVVPEHGLVYVGLEYERPWAQGALTAFDLRSGAKVWEVLTRRFQHGSAAYWRAGDLLIWGSADHEMLALRPDTGQKVWSFQTGRSVKYAASVDEERGLVAFASFDKSIYLLDATTGAKLGQWPTGAICYTTPLMAAGRLFCGSGDRQLYVIDLDSRRLIKKIDLNARIYSSPRLIDGHVMFGTNGGKVVEVDVETLEITATLQLPDAITNAVVASSDGSRLFVSSYMNHLFAFERNCSDVKITS